jgi:hypothetical protein
MEEEKTVTYDDMVENRRILILKSAIPFLNVASQRNVALLIQFLELINAGAAFSKSENSMAACALPDPAERRNAMLAAIRAYATPQEQETIDNIMNMLCVMNNL